MNIQPKDTSKGHLVVSLMKSSIRILATVALARGDLQATALLFALAEVLGIAEELV